ncbi:MAG: hypothetical protein Q8R31_03355 [Candidatus Omnitrophota bacterium]|nr:hypothetical protein [Candidatus Omnitrophota bacterium]
MDNKASKEKSQKGCSSKKEKTISYRLKCAKTANGLSHYVMYGDVDKKQALL